MLSFLGGFFVGAVAYKFFGPVLEGLYARVVKFFKDKFSGA